MQCKHSKRKLFNTNYAVGNSQLRVEKLFAPSFFKPTSTDDADGIGAHAVGRQLNYIGRSLRRHCQRRFGDVCIRGIFAC